MIKKLKIYSLILLYSLIIIIPNAQIMAQSKNYSVEYQVSMPNPNTHYFEVEMKIKSDKLAKQDHIDLLMPVWTPGSYLIREFPKNVDIVEAFTKDKKLVVNKIDKATWRINKGNSAEIVVKYSVYAYELTVRTSYLDNTHGYINGASVFMYVPELKNEKSSIKVIPHASFSKVSVELPEIEKNRFEAENYDLVVDSPIEIGNHEILEFEALGVQHRIANYSIVPLNYNKEKLLADYKKVVESAASVVGEKHPCKSYLFIVHHLPHIGGGLEHLNSTTCQTEAEAYLNPAKYQSFLGLIAHEYFHLWNVKRIRPFALGPFDYQKENYTHMLWVSEGFTSFYQEDLLRRANLIDETTFLNLLNFKIASTENAPGNKIQSAAESSWDAWIKFYRPNENSNNSTISYYTKGGVIATVLNAIIIDKTNAQKSLDDVFKLLWKEYYIDKKRGFTDDEFRLACNRVAGVDLTSFFDKHIFGTETIDYKQYFEPLNLDFSFEYPGLPYTGINTRNRMVTRVEKGSWAYENGIYVNDEIVAVNGINFTDNADFTKNVKVGDSIIINLVRNGQTQEIKIPIVADPNKKFTFMKGTSTDPIKILKYSKFMHIN